MRNADVVVLGSYVQDHCWSTERFPAPGESRIGTFSTGPGGKGFNQAVAAHRLGVRTAFLGAIGRDALGDNALAFAGTIGMTAHWERLAGVPTSASSIVVDASGQNQIVVALAANLGMTVDFVRSHQRLIAGAEIFLTQFETDLQATAEGLALARRAGVATIVNAAPIHDGVTREMFADVDVITPNETEFAFFVARLFGMTPPARYWEMDDPLLHELCRATRVATVVITLGERGCFVSHADPASWRDTHAYYRVPAETARAVDTTGAGDAFNGGLAAALARAPERPFREAVVLANRVAALSVEVRGTAPAMPTLAAVQERFGG